MEFSEFFSEKINGFDRFGNELKFDYTQYNHETIKLFLDLLHGISIRFGESRHTAWYLERVIPRLVELLGFLAYEGKNGTGSYLKLVLILKFKRSQTSRNDFKPLLKGKLTSLT